jgi:hypothetical protein
MLFQMKKYLIISALLVSAIFSQAAPAVITIPLSFDAEWAYVVSKMTNQGTEIALMDKASGIIQTKPILVGTGLITAAKMKALGAIEPSGVMQVYDQGYVTLNYYLTRKSANQTTISFTPIFKTVSHGLWESAVVLQWQSNGKLEAQFIAGTKANRQKQ